MPSPGAVSVDAENIPDKICSFMINAFDRGGQEELSQPGKGHLWNPQLMPHPMKKRKKEGRKTPNALPQRPERRCCLLLPLTLC